MFEFTHKIYRKLFGRKWRQNYKKPDVYFESLTVADKTPKNDEVGDKDFIMVIYQKNPLWALFRCPCGCRHVISLSLQQAHNPNWKVQKTLAGRPTVYPSIRQSKGCYSHFWIEDGRVFWAQL